MPRVQGCVHMLVISLASKWGIKICKSARSQFTRTCSLYDDLYQSKFVLINKRSTTFSQTADKKTILNTRHAREQAKTLIKTNCHQHNIGIQRGEEHNSLWHEQKQQQILCFFDHASWYRLVSNYQLNAQFLYSITIYRVSQEERT